MPAETTMMYFQAASMLSASPFESDEKGADQRGELDRDPIDPDAVHQGPGERGRPEACEERIEPEEPGILVQKPHVSDGVYRGEEIDDRRAHEDPRGRAVDEDVVAPKQRRAIVDKERQRQRAAETLWRWRRG